MKLKADRSGNTRYFYARLGWKEQFDPKEIEILSAGAVPMLIPPMSVHGRKNHTIQYDISQYSTLEFYLSCILSCEQLADLMLQCINVFQRMQQIYLNHKNLVLDLDKTYILLSDRSIHFVYLPLVDSKLKATIQNFFQLLVQKAGRSTYEQVHFLDECAAWLQRPVSFGLNEFESFIRATGTTGDAVPVGAIIQPDADLPRSAKPEQPRFYKPTPVPSTTQDPHSSSTAGLPTQSPSRHGGTIVLGANSSSVPKPRFFLIRQKTNERIELFPFPFVIGIEAESVTYCVADNQAISRRHAIFLLRGDQCVIEDMDSTNKTYVNYCELSPKTEQVLKNSDKIRLANEDFIFFQEV